MGSLPQKNPVKIASASGAVTDLSENIAELAKNADVDFIIGDWMSEYNMSARGTEKSVSKQTGQSHVEKPAAFEYGFLDAVKDALPDLQRRKIRLAVNAGASDTEKLHDALVTMVKEQGLNLKIAWLEGDECLEVVKQCSKDGMEFRNITTGHMLSEWGFEPIYAQCYLGAWGIVEAFKQGADIVVCGRVADAAPTMAAAAYWHGWERSQYKELAHSLIAGHLIECSFYISGGNFSGFKSLPQGTSPLMNPPIARVLADGTFYLECHEISGRSGEISLSTCRSQLLYELQGKRYYNNDTVAIIDQIMMEEVGRNSVYIHNIECEKPPPTTKVGITAVGGFQAEVHYLLAGLDIEEKAAMLEKQLRYYLETENLTVLKFTISGQAASNPASLDACTLDFRIFAQAKTEEAVSQKNFLVPCFNIVMSTFPGATFAVDARQGVPKLFNEYFVTILPINRIQHIAHLPFSGKLIAIDACKDTVPYRFEQDIEQSEPVSLSTFGPTTSAPLGYVVHSRSGDKGSDCNVGFYVRHADEYPWLRSLLSVEMIKQLLGRDYNRKRVERFELPNIHAVHFLLKDHLDRGVSSNSTYDVLGKMVGEYLRAKHVEIPNQFLERGNI